MFDCECYGGYVVEEGEHGGCKAVGDIKLEGAGECQVWDAGWGEGPGEDGIEPVVGTFEGLEGGFGEGCCCCYYVSALMRGGKFSI